jgi:CheY-like chemotaxis protein
MNVVVVDDDGQILGFTRLILERMGHAVREFSDPAAAVASLGNGDVDLVISDIVMPGMDGFGVAAETAKRLGSSPPRVLLVSGNDEQIEKADRVAPSVVIGVLRKPYGVDAFARVISALARTRTCCPGAIFPFCPRFPEGTGALGGTERATALCASARYAECRLYEDHCGRAFRVWISAHNGGTRPEAPGDGGGEAPEGGRTEGGALGR